MRLVTGLYGFGNISVLDGVCIAVLIGILVCLLGEWFILDVCLGGGV